METQIDQLEDTVDICLEIEMNERVSVFLQSSQSEEYSQISWMDQCEIRNLLEGNQMVLSSSLAVLRHLGII